MHDPRIDQLAKQLVGYSTAIKRGDNVLIDLYDTPDSIAVALVRATRAAGGTPYVQLHRSRVSRELLAGATAKQYATISKHALR